MPRLTRYLILAAASILPPLVALALGARTLVQRERPARLPRLSAEAAARIPRPGLDPARPTVVVVLGADVTEVTDALGPYEMFARTARFNVVTAAPERQPTLLSGGLQVVPHYSLAELDTHLAGAPAMVVVPNIPNIADEQNGALVAWLRRQSAAGAMLHSWCKGAMALAHAGLLDGRTATAHWGDLPRLEKRYPRVRWVRGVRWVDHGQLVMSAGITSGVDASLRVIARLAGDSVARRVASEIRYPDYHFAHDPAAPQFSLQPADLIVLANAAFRAGRERIGMALYPGASELDLAHLYDAHAYTMVASVVSVGQEAGVVSTAHGLTLLPSVALSDAGTAAVVRGLDRLVMPGVGARERGASLAAALGSVAPALQPEYIHADHAARYGAEPMLEDLARTADVPTARFALRRLEYRSPSATLAGSQVAWGTMWLPLALAALGLLVALAAPRLVTRRALLASAVAAAVLAPSAMPAQSLESIAPGTRIRADLHRADVSRLRRTFAQPLAGELVALAGDTIVMAVRAGAEPLRIPRSALRDVYVSRGRPNRAESALRRAVVPAIAAAAFNALAVTVRPREGDPSAGRAALSGAASSAAIAGALGALFPQERWRRVRQ